MDKKVKTFSIFNNTKSVQIDYALICEYEKYFPEVKNYTIECMILNEGEKINAPVELLKMAAEKGLKFDIYMATHDANEVAVALRRGKIR